MNVDAVGLNGLVLRLLIATLVGGILGSNRELHGKAAGVRTHALVSLGAAIVTVAMLRQQVGGTVSDPNAIGRIIQGILTGIGFLGAGVILRDAGGHVSGLTTAATIWVCAALGIVCGLGYWSIVGISVGLTLAVLLFGEAFERVAERIFKRNRPEPSDHEG
jgi:putative Mg2+ transporter-C (MgtC) family protein